jgi:hypothetical protein
LLQVYSIFNNAVYCYVVLDEGGRQNWEVVEECILEMRMRMLCKMWMRSGF